VIDPAAATLLCHHLADLAGVRVTARDPIRVWALSGVERLHLADGSTAVLKYAVPPFTREREALAAAAAGGVPTPALRTWTVSGGMLGMLLEDLGHPTRDADAADAADAAARLHAIQYVPSLAWLGETALAQLPGQAIGHLNDLWTVGRYPGTGDLLTRLLALDIAAPTRAAGAERPPFGLCHGELHPTSVHVGAGGWRLVDFGMAHNGPGLLDLATWYGTRTPPDPATLRQLIDRYVAAGGHPGAHADRGGLDAAGWALAWHRIHAAAWLLEQAAARVFSPDTDARHVQVLRRQLAGAVDLLIR
jgi:hypothetical protein